MHEIGYDSKAKLDCLRTSCSYKDKNCILYKKILFYKKKPYICKSEEIRAREIVKLILCSDIRKKERKKDETLRDDVQNYRVQQHHHPLKEEVR